MLLLVLDVEDEGVLEQGVQHVVQAPNLNVLQDRQLGQAPAAKRQRMNPPSGGSTMGGMCTVNY